MEDLGQMKKTTVLVTGGAGFIGSHLTEDLLKKGYSVVVDDIEIKKNSYFEYKKIKRNVFFEKVDIRDKNKIEKLFAKYKPAYVFHLAAQPIVEEAFDNPYPAFETNIMGTVNVLEAARKFKGLKGVIVASSDKAYGKTDKKYNENSPLIGDHPYDVSKSAADLISQAYFKSYNLPVVITRFGNVYGEGDIYLNRIVPGICKAVIDKKTLLVRSNGKYVRDYLYVKDVVSGYIFLLDNFKKLVGHAYNFSSTDSLSVLDLIKKSEKILKVKIPYKILNTAKNEIPYQHLDDSRIRKFGWKSKYALEETLPKVLEWYKNINETKKS